MRIVAAFLLLAVFASLALFLTFTSSWGSILLPHSAPEVTPGVVEAPSPTPESEGAFTVDVTQPVILRSDPYAAAQTVGILRKGERVSITGCDAEGLWCRTQNGEWFVSYMVGQLPVGLPVLDVAGNPTAALRITPAPTLDAALLAATAMSTEAPAQLLLPTPTPIPTTPPQAAVTDAANLRGGPGTTFAIVGQATAGEILFLAGKTPDAEWYQTESGSWIAGFLLADAPVDVPVIGTADATDASVAPVQAGIVVDEGVEDDTVAPEPIGGAASGADAGEDSTATSETASQSGQ